MTLTTCDLIVLLKETEIGLVGSMTFKRGTFDSKNANDLGRRFFAILKCVMKNPESTIGRVRNEVSA